MLGLLQNGSAKDPAKEVEESFSDQGGLEGNDGITAVDEDIVMDPTRDDDIAMQFGDENGVGEDDDIGLCNDREEEMASITLGDQVCNMI